MSFARATLPALCLLLGLGACNAQYGGTTSGSSVPVSDGSLSNMDACVQSCDSAMARCMDAGSARRTPDSMAATIYGAKSDCEASLRSCLPKCNGR